MGFGQRATENGEILRVNKYRPAANGSIAGDNPVAGNLHLLHAEIMAAMLDEHVPFLE